MDFDLQALYEALDVDRRSRAMSWQELARAMSDARGKVRARSISPSTLSGLRNRRAVEGDGVLQILRWLHRTPESFAPGYDGAFGAIATLPEPAGNQILRFDTRAIYIALDARRMEQGMTWKQVADAIGGFSPVMLTHLSRGKRTGFPHVMRITRWLGRPVAHFTRFSDR